MSDSFVTPWTVAPQAPLSMELSTQEYWSGLPFPPPGNFPDPGIEPEFLVPPVQPVNQPNKKNLSPHMYCGKQKQTK